MNRPFTAYDASNGKVLYCGDAYNPEILSTDSVGILLDSKFSSGWVIEGHHCSLPQSPSEHHLFDYATKQWVDPRTPDAEWKLIRAERDRRLLACDWTQLPDVPLATKEAWASYRQALRDITGQPDPFNIVWPAAPG